MWKIFGVLTCLSILIIIATALLPWNTSSQNRMDMNLVVTNNLQEFGVKVIESNNSSFDAQLREYVGESNYDKVLPVVAAAKPSAIFIRNESEKEIVGVALRWLFVRNDGTITETKQMESSPGALLGMKPRDPFMVGKTSIINAGAAAYFTHYQGLGTPVLNFFKSNRSGRFKYDLDAQRTQTLISEVAREKNTTLKDVKEISVVIDAIIFKDGTFVGENQAHLVELTKGTIQARRDFLKEIREAKSLNKSDAEALNHFISNSAKRKAGGRSIKTLSEGEAMFHKSYENHMTEYAREITMTRLKATDDIIVKELLMSKDSDFVELRQIGGQK